MLPQSAMPPAGAATAAGRVLEVSGPGEELLLMVFPHLRGLRIMRVEDTGEAVAIRAGCRGPHALASRRAGRVSPGSMARMRGWWLTARPAGRPDLSWRFRSWALPQG